MRFLRLCIVVIGIVLSSAGLGAGATAEADPTANKPTDHYLIGPGDLLEISVWNEPDLSKTVTVRLDNRISMPLVGDVVVTGISLKDLSDMLTHKFSKYISNPNVVAMLQESNSKRYYIIGRVNEPGEFPLDSPLTVLQSLARARGFMEWAEPEKIIILRPENEREAIYPFDYYDVIKGKNLQQNIKILAGDTIIVP